MSDSVSVTVTRQEKYRFLVEFGGDMDPITGDEPPPLGDDAGPSPTQMLAAAVANCLSATLVFSLQRFKEDPGPMVTAVEATIGRNEQRRLRVVGLSAEIRLGTLPAQLPHIADALAQFEDFCTVSQSVKAGIPLDIRVVGPDGTRLK